jgi:starch synthase
VRIAQIASEVAPLAKTGGLGDVAAALSRYLDLAGHDVRLFAPFYSKIDLGDAEVHPVEFLADVPLALGPHRYSFTVRTTQLPGTRLWIYLVDCPALYHRPGIYTSGPDEHLRFLLLTRAAIESCQRMGWAPEVMHLHDWHTALAPLYLRSVYAWDRLFADTKTVLTIHNIAYQGVVAASAVDDLGLGGHRYLLHQDHLAAGRVNFLEHGLLYADLLTTVSHTHAEELKTDEYGFGLQGLLRDRADGLVGIVNGVDVAEWDPATDPHVPHRYSAADLTGKAQCKRELLERLRLAPDPPGGPPLPLVGIVSRFTHQKGFDLAYQPLTEALGARRIRLVALGSGDGRVEDFFRRLQGRFPDRVCFVNAYSDPLAHWIEAASDLFLMPSRYEPCGLNQMYSLRYGTPPVVRKTGGLADTVEPWDPAAGTGTGFVFDHPTAQGVRWALVQALDAFADRDGWAKLIQNGMARDFSWERPIGEYEAVYRRALGVAG